MRSYRTVSAFLPFLRAEARVRGGVFFSVALSVGSPRPAVSWHLALWSPDFPHAEARLLFPSRVSVVIVLSLLIFLHILVMVIEAAIIVVVVAVVVVVVQI